ncbi:IS3 family transposase [Ruminococcus sp.]|uniref:IS3 family transposase n=1 Tax=Ruminococcus sp. TaxID=41978 RepID=UPI002670135D|nr:IS3 family transposase [uncultured Ruminococcus sp.]
MGIKFYYTGSNLIKRNFSADKPLKKLLTDITEVQCADGKLYVSPILDCFNGEIVALEMRDNMKKELCIDTVKQLREKYGRLDGTVLHSDRGCQYTSYAFRRELVINGLIQNLSGTAHCYDNARMESFFATLKKEKLYQIPTYRMKHEKVKTVIFRYIFGYYNTQRINSFNEGSLPPVALRTSKQLSHHAA